MALSRSARWWRALAIVTALLLIPQSMVLGANPRTISPSSELTWPADAPVLVPGAAPLKTDEEAEEELLQLDLAIISEKLAGDNPLTLGQATRYRQRAGDDAAALHGFHNGWSTPSDPASFDSAWDPIGPSPMGEVTRSTPILETMNGRIGALAIRSNGDWILGGAQGGIWVWTFDGSGWEPKTDYLPSLAIGALALAPTDDSIVYAGTGEGALSGDSYFGNGILKSTDGGQTWSHVSGNFFQAVSISRLVVDPTNANHLYAAVLSGRGGARRTGPPLHSRYGIWESKDGARHWKLVQSAPDDTHGATDLEMDPQNPSILYSSFWGDQIYKSTDGGQHWTPIMSGLPTLYNLDNLTRWSISVSHPAGQDPVLYAGTDFIDDTGTYQNSRVFRSDDEGASWTELPLTGFAGSDDSVLDYCGGQCWYDNVIEADPTNTDVVYAGGQFNYGIGSGGIFRSDDGGQTWKNLGWDQHPDFHAFAFDPNDPNSILSGSDGGVWWSPDRGGRMPGSAEEAMVDMPDWYSVNDFGLQIGQFTSVATNPSFFIDGQTPRERVWGGTQDNGTLRKSTLSNTWFDMFSGDGGQVLVDPTDWTYVYGTYYGISPYRATDGGAAFFTNQYITNGINLNDRSDFYIPWVMNKDNPNQLFLGTYRLYRTDNAKAPSAANVTWKAISGDLTTGCSGTAPNGARNCSISAIGIGGGTAAYVGTLDGVLSLSTDAKTSANPTWTQLDPHGKLPNRPISQIAVDRSNYRIAYVAYNGFNRATPHHWGHVFMTTDGGKHFKNISGNLPDVPVNSIILDPSYPHTLYAGTDVGPYVTYDGGRHWSPMGTGFPIVSIWQMDMDTGAPAGENGVAARTILAGTHGRGVFRMTDDTAVSALQVSKVDAGVPVGPSSQIDYTLTVKNIGNGDATGVKVTDPIPGNTRFASASDGGVFKKSGHGYERDDDHGRNGSGQVEWSGISLAPGESIDLHFSVTISSRLSGRTTNITNDGIVVTSAEGQGATGSPTVTPIAPAHAVNVTPASQTDGARAGMSVDYLVSVKNESFNTDSFAMTASGNSFPTSFFEADCSTPLTSTAPLTAGTSQDVCVQVDVPGGAANDETSTATVTATSTGDGSVSASVQVATIAVTVDTLLVDNDGNGPDVQSYYATALDDAGVSYSVWDLSADSTLPLNYLESFSNVVWFTGNSYPGPVLPYEDELTSFLDGGGNLFMSGQDILDQAAGTTDFVLNYLHITWDGLETQNDIPTADVTGVLGNPVTGSIGTIGIDHSVLGAVYEDEITPNGTAEAAFTDSDGQTNALTYSDGYKVVFLAFPFEAYGSAADKATLMTNVMTFFGP